MTIASMLGGTMLLVLILLVVLIVLLGAAAPFLGIAPEKLEAGIRAIFARKGDAIVDTNLAAFRAGYAYAQKQTAQWEGCR